MKMRAAPEHSRHGLHLLPPPAHDETSNNSCNPSAPVTSSVNGAELESNFRPAGEDEHVPRTGWDPFVLKIIHYSSEIQI